ncbi:MAG: GtrA family protein, partial [Gammaproteobacteria bacterium]
MAKQPKGETSEFHPLVWRLLRGRGIAVQFLNFSGVGAIATFLHYAILVLSVHLAGADPTLASSGGFILAAFFHYAMNYRLTLRSTKRH